MAAIEKKPIKITETVLRDAHSVPDRNKTYHRTDADRR